MPESGRTYFSSSRDLVEIEKYLETRMHISVDGNVILLVVSRA